MEENVGENLIVNQHFPWLSSAVILKQLGH